VQNAFAARLQNAPYLSNVNRLLADPEPPQAEQVASNLECKAGQRRSPRSRGLLRVN
jgi:hypothetical protein